MLMSLADSEESPVTLESVRTWNDMSLFQPGSYHHIPSFLLHTDSDLYVLQGHLRVVVYQRSIHIGFLGQSVKSVHPFLELLVMLRAPTIGPTTSACTRSSLQITPPP